LFSLQRGGRGGERRYLSTLLEEPNQRIIRKQNTMKGELPAEQAAQLSSTEGH
jgi:hypothetical protein